MKADEFQPERRKGNVPLRWAVTAAAMVFWCFLMAMIGSELRQIFQPLGMGLAGLGFFAAFTGVGVALIFMLLSPRQHCPECGGALPRLRKPVSLGHALWGGWECPHCHADLSPEGRKVSRKMGDVRRGKMQAGRGVHGGNPGRGGQADGATISSSFPDPPARR